MFTPALDRYCPLERYFSIYDFKFLLIYWKHSRICKFVERIEIEGHHNIWKLDRMCSPEIHAFLSYYKTAFNFEILIKLWKYARKNGQKTLKDISLQTL